MVIFGLATSCVRVESQTFGPPTFGDVVVVIRAVEIETEVWREPGEIWAPGSQEKAISG